jgi:ppGpp synthetase/RelA/SpoT-type nucleotidyltranferase
LRSFAFFGDPGEEIVPQREAMVETAAVDLSVHAKNALSEYFRQHEFYKNLAVVLKRVLDESLKQREIKVHSVEARAKSPESFEEKAAQQSEQDPTQPKYEHPLEQITDLAAARIITYFPSTLADIGTMLQQEFRIVERSDKGAELIEEERFGYQSIHYLVKLSTSRSRLPEYAVFAGAVVEIQVRTILQHAWAEIEHDIQYKSAEVIPVEIRRRFMALSGMLELGDREFQAIQDEDRRLREEARARVQGGDLQQVEITPDALRAFLDKRIGPDGRISEFSYNWTARLLRKLGFRSLQQVEKCIEGYDDDYLSRIAAGGRLGQTQRFEFMLLAGMGEVFIKRHVYAEYPWFAKRWTGQLAELRRAKISIREYDPLTDVPEARPPAGESAVGLGLDEAAAPVGTPDAPGQHQQRP